VNKLRLLTTVLVLIVLGFGIQAFINLKKSSSTPTTQTNTEQTTPPPAGPPPPDAVAKLASPIDRADERVTKKPFGIFITKEKSPVQPERFSGYHTGTDFETFPDETNSEVPFYAICDGKILQKRTASGYGGVLVESCTIDDQTVTIIYGHLSLKSISKIVGDSLSKGEKIGNLGHSPDETDGERKHLHLGIHKGNTINILGYTPSQSALSDWLDYETAK
jgi:murein DD-endopeptidase MepM/ murein hydrolase activator NlpD